MLTPTDVTVLTIAAGPSAHNGRLAAEIHRELGWTETRWAQRLNVLIDDPAALEYTPDVVRRWRRLRAGRKRGPLGD